jgi:hypothetical protein
MGDMIGGYEEVLERVGDKEIKTRCNMRGKNNEIR